MSPFVFGVDPAKIEGPLQQFQATTYDREDVFTLVRSINSRLDAADQVGFEVLRKEFEVWWPEFEKRIDVILATQQLENETGYEWLYTTKDLARHMMKPQHVWIVAQHLYRNALVSPARDVIGQNLRSGAAYTFIISESDDGGELQRIRAAYPGRVRVVRLDEDEFQKNAVTDYFIIDPDTDTAAVFLELPVEARGYWIEVDREAAIGLISRFRKFVDRPDVAAAAGAGLPT